MVTVEFDDRLEDLQDILDTLKLHHLPVMKDGALFGVVSDPT